MEPTTKLVVLVSLYFMILFSAFNAFQTIVTKIHEDEGDRSLGPFTFAVTYFVFMVSNFFVSESKYSQKWQMTLASLTYALNYLTGFFMAGRSSETKYILATAGAVVNGIGGSFLWTSIGAYIHKACHLHGKEDEKGHYFGLFNTIFCISTVLGALVITFGLSTFDHDIYFAIVAGVAFMAFLYGVLFIKDIKIEEQEQQSQSKVTIWQSVKNSAASTIKFYPRMKYTLGLVFLNGINIGVTTSTMLHVMPTTADAQANNLNAGICLVLHGVGCVAGGYLGGRLCDRLRIRLSSTIYVFGYCVVCLATIAAALLDQMYSARVVCFLWGAVLYYLTANQMVICSRLYEGKPQAFAVIKQFHCISFIVYEVVALSTENSLPVTNIMLAIILFAIPAFWGVHNAPEESRFYKKDSLQSERQEPGQRIEESLVQSSH